MLNGKGRDKFLCRQPFNYIGVAKTLHKHLHTIDFKHARISQLPDFVAIQQFHSSRAFVEVIAERNTAVPALDFTRARPEFEIYGFGRLEHTFERGDVDSVGH